MWLCHRGTISQATCFKGHVQTRLDLLHNDREELHSNNPWTLPGVNNIKMDAEGYLLGREVLPRIFFPEKG